MFSNAVKLSRNACTKLHFYEKVSSNMKHFCRLPKIETMTMKTQVCLYHFISERLYRNLTTESLRHRGNTGGGLLTPLLAKKKPPRPVFWIGVTGHTEALYSPPMPSVSHDFTPQPAHSSVRFWWTQRILENMLSGAFEMRFSLRKKSPRATKSVKR